MVIRLNILGKFIGIQFADVVSAGTEFTQRDVHSFVFKTFHRFSINLYFVIHYHADISIGKGVSKTQTKTEQI